MNNSRKFTRADEKAIRGLLAAKGQRIRIHVGCREDAEGEGFWTADTNRWAKDSAGDIIDDVVLGCISSIARDATVHSDVQEGTRLDLYIYDYDALERDWDMRGNTEVVWQNGQWSIGAYAC
jgi:hypothetical protein